ncbi:MAG: protein kinase domain-containing protein [Candidatus Latescibacterota bacterium]
MLRRTLNASYEIIRKLGTGGMASVYLAREIALNREVAIKLLPQSLLRDEQFIIRFKREALLSAMLEHPNIVRIYSIGEETDLFYFVMNYISGGALSDRMKSQHIIPVRNLIHWGRDICMALGYAHEHGVVHRDLKPDNILLDQDGRAIVTDFGIAHAALGTSLTRTGAVIGTPQYMSPDQACGKTPDARSDIYSLGMVFYQMVAGRLPFQSDDPVSLMYMHVHKTPESPRVYNPEIPHWLCDIILRCLAKKPENRFQSAQALQSALMEGYSGKVSPKSPLAEGREKYSFINAALNVFSSALPGPKNEKSGQQPVKEKALQSRARHSLKLPRNLMNDSPAAFLSPRQHGLLSQ